MSATVRRPVMVERPQHEEAAESAGFLPVIRRWWWLLAAAAIAAGAAGYVVASGATPTYRAQVELLVGPINADIETLRASGLLAQTYAELATSRPIRDAVKRELGIDSLGGSLETKANDVTRLISIRVTHTDRELSAQIANGLAAELIELSSRGSGPKTPAGATATDAGRLRVIDAAKPGRAAVGTSAKTAVPLAAIAGLLAALGLAVLLDRSRDRIGGSDELELIADAPFLGGVVHPRGPPLLVERSPESTTVRQLSLLAAKLALGGGTRSLLVTTVAEVGDGRLAAELAAAISRSGGVRVALVDADDQTFAVTSVLELDGRPGTVELLRHPAESWSRSAHMNGYLVPRGPALDVLPHGMPGSPRAPEPAQARALVARLLEHADIVVVATAPVDRSPSSLAWARAVDGAVLVVERNRTRRRELASAAESLRVVGATLVGTVLGDRQRRFGRA